MSGPISDIVDRINRQLRDEFGIEMTSERPIYRIVWSNDQFEKRLMHYTDAGIQLLTPEVREVPKYKQWAADRYILEKLQYIEVETNGEMTVHKVSYEPIWTFMDNQMRYLPPRYDVAKIIIDTMNAAIHGDHSLAKYKDTNDADLEERQKTLKDIQEELFGNETPTGDALAYGEGVGYTGPSKIESEKVN